MATTYTFTPTALTAYANKDGQQDVVYFIGFNFSATDGTYGYLTKGSCSTTYVPGDPFTPYQDLTEEQVVGWIEESLGPQVVAEMKAQADASIASQKAPVVITPPLPWG